MSLLNSVSAVYFVTIFLTLVLLNPDIFSLENGIDLDQMASNESKGAKIRNLTMKYHT